MKTCDICKNLEGGCTKDCPLPTPEKTEQFCKDPTRKPLDMGTRSGTLNLQKNLGWTCPVCNSGLAPHVDRCSCQSGRIHYKSSDSFWKGKGTQVDWGYIMGGYNANKDKL